jgi:fumarate hydratase class II
VSTRIEKDTLGEVTVPAGAYYGAQTARALENFPITGRKPSPVLVRAYAFLKKAAAEVNCNLRLLDDKLAGAIVKACDEVLAGKLLDEFVIDPFQAGAGTSHNMNVNEVLANRANEILGGVKGKYDPVHPNDHVNMAQSTNDTFPAAMRIAILLEHGSLLEAVERATSALRAKGREFDDVITSARTHLQDAVPIRLGQEFGAYSFMLERARRRLEQAALHLRRSNIGATAAGTGLNSHADYHRQMVNRLSELTGLPIEEAGNLIEVAQSTSDFAHYSSSLRGLALDLTKLANDLRLLASGPNTGFNEIRLPAVQPGSSIMPGKVNPSILECVNQICFHVIGLDTGVSYATQAGQLQLNVMMPVIVHELLEAQLILRNGLKILTDKCIVGIAANEEVCRRYFESSPSLATALNPVIGYVKAAEIVKKALAQGKTVVQVVREDGVLSEGDIRRYFEPKRLTKPGVLGK